MWQTVKRALQAIIDAGDAGNTNLTEEECLTIIDTINRLTQKERLISKYQAYTYLNVSRATFDRLVQSNESIGRYQIGRERVCDITALDIQFYINQITKDGYSFSTIKKQLELLRASLRKAVKLKLIPDNPAMEIGMPNKDIVKKPKKIKAYDTKDQERLQEYIETHTDNNAVLCVAFMIETGLRSGEALALRWSEVNTDKHKCHVCATVVNPHLPSKAYVQDTPKTDSSIRTVPLNVRATTILSILKRRASSEFVFGSNNNRLEYPTLIRTIKKMCRESNVDYLGAHVFRHTFATNCYYKGIDIKILSKLLGHSDVKVTYNTYIDLYGDGFDDMYAALCL